MSEKNELLPCPFCGGPVQLERSQENSVIYGRREFWGVVCRNTWNVGGTCANQQIPSASKEAATDRWNRRAALTPPRQMVADSAGEVTFQARVQPWMLECFGAEIAADQQERNHRFLEEALELVQACGATASEAHQLVDYVYGRPVGDKHQEAGGVMVTLAALCLAQGLDMHAAGETELARIWTKVEQIRAKQAAKPKHSPLPAAQQGAAQGDCDA